MKDDASVSIITCKCPLSACFADREVLDGLTDVSAEWEPMFDAGLPRYLYQKVVFLLQIPRFEVKNLDIDLKPIYG